MKFSDLHLAPVLLRSLEQEGYTLPTPIQQAAIPPALEGRDILGCAQTGTGKTAAFALPILQCLDSQSREKYVRRPIRALVLTPTRELAMQIFESFQAYGRFTRLRYCVVFGGVSQHPQTEQLKRGVDVLIATPGRLNDLIQQGYIDLQQVQCFVLDEADRMLDMGFIYDVKKVIARLPRQKQTLFFSATMPPEITELVDSLLTDPVKVAVDPVSSTVDTVSQSVYFVDKDNKHSLLIHLLRDSSIYSALVFTRTKHGADRVVKELTRARIPAMAIHGDKSQNARQTALKDFKSGKLRVLVATDIAARGIDIEELSHVINYDLPNIPETYVHRIGRTGRAGLSGTAISFCDIDEKPYLASIEKLIGKKVPVVEEHPYPMVNFTPTPKSERARRQQYAHTLPDGTPVKRQGRPRSDFPTGEKEKREAPSAGRSSDKKPAAPFQYFSRDSGGQKNNAYGGYNRGRGKNSHGGQRKGAHGERAPRKG